MWPSLFWHQKKFGQKNLRNQARAWLLFIPAGKDLLVPKELWMLDSFFLLELDLLNSIFFFEIMLNFLMSNFARHMLQTPTQRLWRHLKYWVHWD